MVIGRPLVCPENCCHKYTEADHAQCLGAVFGHHRGAFPTKRTPLIFHDFPIKIMGLSGTCVKPFQ